MADLLQTGLAWLHGQRAAHLVSPAAYVRRGGTESVAIEVTASQVRHVRIDVSGMPVEALAVDFIAAAGALPAYPEPGDRIEFNGRRYEVTPLDGDACWRWTDTSRLARRIHTRDMGDVTP